MKDTLCSYYTNSDDITSYMAGKLDIKDLDVVLEPSAGEGIFIDEILKTGKSLKIDALDMNRDAITILKEKYRNNPSVNVRETDTLLDEQLDIYGNTRLWLKNTDTMLDEQLDLFASIGGHYNKVIGNPPYGAWQDYQKRDLLKKKYSGQYVKETYSLFLLRCLSVLKLHGKLSFIIPDTFLFLNMHSRLREILLTKSKINEILIFPSKFFPGVSFGYSNLSIITLERCNRDEALDNVVRVIKGFKKPGEFIDILTSNIPSHFDVYQLQQRSILSNPQHRFVLADTKMEAILKNTPQTLGDIADIVTGFYTGDNLTFIKVLNKDVKGSKKYDIINSSQVFNCSSIDGISDVQEGYIPYIKSASKTKYLRGKDEWFVRWDKDTIEFYNSNKKSRFQNSEYYFKTGIGIPMVKSKIIRAFLMKDRVFDQSIVGIFPKDDSKLYYLLALMNSETVNNLIHLINPTANNSSNYIKLIPYIEPDKASYNKVVSLVEKIIHIRTKQPSSEINTYENEINTIINKTYENIA